MARINFRLTHKIMAIALIGVAAVAVFGAIYLIGATSQEASRQLAEKARAAASCLDQVGVLQTEAATTLPPEENPLLIDDRRRRAHKR